MKKLKIAATIVCAAAFVQAATIKWSSNAMSLTDASGTAITALDKGSLVLVSMATATDWANAVEIPTAASQTSEKTTLTISSRAGKEGQVSGTLAFAFDSASGSNLIDNGDYLALMYKNEKGGLEQLVYTSGDGKGDPVAAAWKVDGLQNNSTSLNGIAIPMNGNFSVAAVPEPTSAMLLLLGVAGLALRRKQK